MSFRRRAATGVSLAGNYTLSHCEADTYFSGGWFQFEEGYLDPSNPSFDRGNCVSSRQQVANLSVSAQTPQFDSPAMNLLASNWRAAGILNARSGSRLTVTTTGDVAGTGLETSMDVEFRVDLIKQKAAAWPRLENATHIMVLGSARPLLQAFQHATTEMQRWLMADYGFSERAAQAYMGQALEYEIANVVDPNFTVVAKVRKALLPPR